MTEVQAWYLLRALLVAAWEGMDVSTHSTEPGDDEVRAEALRLAGHRLGEHDLWAFPELKESQP